MTRSLRFLAALVALTASAYGQLATNLQFSKTQHVVGEPVLATITITNHVGRELILQGDTRMPWLDIVVKNTRGEPLSPQGRSAFGAVKIGPGQSMSRQVNLRDLFPLFDPGSYSAYALIRMPGSGEVTSTNRVLFNLDPGRLYWSQKVGVPGNSTETREFRLIIFSGAQKSQLYSQVISGRTGLPINTFLIGDAMMVRKPVATIDRNQRMHVMYLATPAIWVHSQTTVDGMLVARDMHKVAQQGDPQLVTLPDGNVRVTNSIPYDPAAVEAARAKVRKASDRPGQANP